VPPTLVWATDAGVDWLVLRGVTPEALVRLRSLAAEDLPRAFPVFPSDVLDGDRAPAGVQPMAGRYCVGDADIRFAPRFPFVAGTAYTMVVGGGGLGDVEALNLTRPPVEGVPSTEVVAVHPSGTALPRNALRLYVEFSSAMSEGLAAGHVHLERDDTGESIPGAFSPLDPELWDPGRRRLTVLLDPARIKRGLSSHREAGYPLEQGAAVALVVERGYRDAGGRPLVAGHRHRYAVGPDVRELVDPRRWVLDVPAAGGRRPLVVGFDRPLDRALLGRCLSVAGPGGEGLGGGVAVGEGEGSWSFTPGWPWLPGPHHLLVEPVLEDLAGNSVSRVFDRDLERPEHEPRAPASVAVPFSVDGDRPSPDGR